MIKRFISGALAAVMLSAAAMPVFAESTASPVTYYAQTTGYKFEKISHPTKPTQQADGIVDYLGNGEVDVIVDESDENYNAGDRGQSYSWSAVAYGDWMYVGTCYAAMGNTMTLMQSVLGDKFDKDTMELTLKTMFNGTFFWGEDDGVDSKGILVKVNTKTGETKLLMSKSLNDISPLFRNAIEYNGKLYFCGSVSANGSSGLPSVYELDPETDEYKVVYQGLSSPYEYGVAYKLGISTGIRGMCVYNGKLIISNVSVDTAAKTGRATILASADPSKGFTEIADSETLFNYPAYRYQDSIYGGSIWDMAEYNGHLYVSICTGTPENQPDDNTMRSFALVRGDENPDGTFTWTSLAGDKENDNARYTFGIDPERTRSGAANLIVYNDYLYIGEYNDEEIALERILFNKTGDGATGQMGGVDCDFVNANLEQSVGIYRMDKNEDMQLVVGNATEMFPEGGISGLGSGFGHNENQYIWRMQVYDGKLYVGTFDTSSLLEPIGRFSNGNIINMTPEEWYTQLTYLKDLLSHLLKPGSGSQATESSEEAASSESAAESAASETAASEAAVSEAASSESAASEAAASEAAAESAASEIAEEETEIAVLSAEPEEAVQAADESEESGSEAASEAAGSETALQPSASEAASEAAAEEAASEEESEAASYNAAEEEIAESEDSASETQAMQLLDLADKLDYAGMLLDDVQTLDEDDSFNVTDRIAYYQAFADQYSEMLEAYKALQQNYSISDEIQKLLDLLLNEESLRRLQSVITCMQYLQKAERGFDMYVTSDGVNFKPLTTNGFNDPYNHGLRVFAVTDQGLCLGTANPFYGTQLWKLVSTSFTPTPTPSPSPSATPDSGSHSGSHSSGNSSSNDSAEPTPTPTPVALAAAEPVTVVSHGGSAKKASKPASSAASSEPEATAEPTASPTPTPTPEPAAAETPAPVQETEAAASSGVSAGLIAGAAVLILAIIAAIVFILAKKRGNENN